MKLEIWMIIGAGVAFAVGFGAVTVLLLGLHAEVRRLSKLAEAAHQALLSNLKQALDSGTASAAPGPRRIAASLEPGRSPESPPAVVEAPSPVTARPPMVVAVAPAAVEVGPELTKMIEATAAGGNQASAVGWSADRSLLVVRLAGRGRTPDQIAAALQIPQGEVEEFLAVNQLMPAGQPARQLAGP